MTQREVSVIVFYDEDNRILLQNRRKISKFGEEYGFFGGSIEDKETPEQTAIRELQEELEYTITSLTFFNTYTAKLPKNTSAKVYVYLTEFPGFEHFNQQEGDGMELVTITKARTLNLLEADSVILNDLESHFSKKPL